LATEPFKPTEVLCRKAPGNRPRQEEKLPKVDLAEAGASGLAIPGILQSSSVVD